MTTRMPDGNTAALREYEASQARAERIYDAYADRVIDDIVDDIVSGRTLKVFGVNYSIHDFINDGLGAAPGYEGVECFLDTDDLVQLLLNKPEVQQDVRVRLLKEIERRVREWCATSERAQEFIDQRCRDWNEDDKQRYGERD